ncbi:MAG TPA: FtsK/SpoIIIE domain-containing protein [Pirellulales bacterium]|nr:FtsK/SpoIIIE domain-containing protein [Pirellulales bacterium]
MTQPLSSEVERTLIAELYRLAAERQAAEVRVQAEFVARNKAAEEDFRRTRQQIADRFKADGRSTQQQYERAVDGPKSDYESAHAAAAAEHESRRRQALDDFEAAEKAATKQQELDTWQATTVFEASHPGLLEQFYRVEAKVNSHGDAMVAIVDQVWQWLELCRMGVAWRDTALPDTTDPGGDPFALLPECVVTAQNRLNDLRAQIAPRFFIGVRPQILSVAILLVAMVTSAVLVHGISSDTIWRWLGIGAALAVAGGVGTLLTLYQRARSHSTALCTALRQALADAERYQQRCRVDAKAYYDSQRAKMAERHKREIREATERHFTTMTQVIADRDGRLTETDIDYERIEKELVERRDRLLAEAHAKHPDLIAQVRRQFEQDQITSQAEHERRVEETRSRHEADWNAMAAAWRDGMACIYGSIDAMNERCRELFPEWHDPAWKTWRPPTSPPPTLRFGQYDVRLDEVPGGMSADPRLNGIGPDVLHLPALLPFPRTASMLIETTGEGRTRGVQVLQSEMLRLLATVPPGKVRFTIVDPVGRGENFAGFMHLADFDDILVTNRIWTERPDIEARLVDLTEQMEIVIQKYLRNDFETIVDYNEFAGEVAEAFRILVVADFPNSFTEAAAARLASIATHGARCGVHVLMTYDSAQALPMKFDIKDIQRHATNLLWQGDKFVWKDPEFEKFPLAVEQPPPDERFTQIVQLVGENAKDSRRVEVPFEYIAPKEDAWWSGSTAKGIDVPLGRAGATKLQHLRLGQGTSQHVLVAGKTGSGKSTLLHALITNLALTFSPAEIELYLIDFKKGVEFKTYATQELPHARVIAIESEREFGLSVLQKLDAELKRRGDLYRALGVQDLNGFRKAKPDMTMPRVLLIIDEFHELFVEDDKIAQDSGLLMDRLVRQGRAFGIHVLLGSQTLGGAYSLARSTLGQMAVRIALQCSETDAHLILSEENSAARLLNRPGEAIYNDANGRMEGNNPFQVVWLSDQKREDYLKRIRAVADRQTERWRNWQIVFEGNVPAVVSRNPRLQELLHAPNWSEPPAGGPQAWLGEAIAIKDPTAAPFRPQNGCNLLLIGQRDEAALGIMATSLLSLAAQLSPAGAENSNGHPASASARFYVVEASRAERTVSGSLANLAGMLPHGARAGGRRELDGIIAEIAEELQRRQTSEKHDAPALFLFVYDLARFRDLRREDDFMSHSFSGEPRPPSVGAQFCDILREGPAVGIHTIVWCDTLNNLNRAVDRQGIREFDLRVLFQMSNADSSNLIDSPAASKLGANLAYFYNEEEGRLEKFRPYAWPTPEFIAFTIAQLQSRRAAAPTDKLAS